MIDNDPSKRPSIEDLIDLKCFSNVSSSIYLPVYESYYIDSESIFEYPELKFRIHNGEDLNKKKYFNQSLFFCYLLKKLVFLFRYLFKIYEKDKSGSAFLENEKNVYNLLGINNQENILKFIGQHKIENNTLIYNHCQVFFLDYFFIYF